MGGHISFYHRHHTTDPHQLVQGLASVPGHSELTWLYMNEHTLHKQSHLWLLVAGGVE